VEEYFRELLLFIPSEASENKITESIGGEIPNAMLIEDFQAY